MKPSASFILPLLGCSSAVASAAEAAARVFTWDAGSSKVAGELQTVEPETAKFIFAQRLGLSDYFSLGDVKAQEVRHINAFGGRQHGLFESEDARNEAHVMVIVEGAENPEDVLGSSSPDNAFSLSSRPSSSSNVELIERLATFARHTGAHANHVTSESMQSISEVLGSLAVASGHVTSGRNAFLHTTLLADMAKQHGFKSPSVKQAVRDVAECITKLEELARNDGFSLTVAVMSGSEKEKRNAYGNLDKPTVHKRRITEAVLSTASASEPTVNDSTSPYESNTLASNGTFLKGIIPSCFSSKSHCESGTNGCSGHGSCVLKFKKTNTDSEDCWSCACTPEVTKTSHGKQTVNYGGPACQKKDVHVPFWLFAGFAVVLAGLISGAIGMLYSMGNEELPSVIGAGVSGPKAR